MGKRMRVIHGRPEGCICDIVAYLPNMGKYPTCSDINKLGEMVGYRRRN